MPHLTKPLPLDLVPMEAEAVTELPSGHGWQYEPKYDGFRCLMHISDRGAQMMSKNQKPLQRFFPELVKALQEQIPNGYVTDGEIISPAGFDALQLRLHPAESRIARLSAVSPCRLRHGARLVRWRPDKNPETCTIEQFSGK